MDFEHLKEFLNKPKQRFLCIAAGQPKSKVFTATITHQVTTPLTKNELAEIDPQLKQMIDFYKNFGSIRFYCDTLSNASAYYIANPNEWGTLKKYFNEWLKDLKKHELKKLVPDWVSGSIVFGEIPQSGNYYLMPLSDHEKGKVFEFEHDGFEFIEIAPDFNSFLQRLTSVNNSLLEEIGGHTRYSDGKSDLQWMPTNYTFSEGSFKSKSQPIIMVDYLFFNINTGNEDYKPLADLQLNELSSEIFSLTRKEIELPSKEKFEVTCEVNPSNYHLKITQDRDPLIELYNDSNCKLLLRLKSSTRIFIQVKGIIGKPKVPVTFKGTDRK